MLLPTQIVSVFKASPFPSLVLSPNSDFTIAEVNQAFLETTNIDEEELIGKALFEVLGGNSENSRLENKERLKESLEKVLATKGRHKISSADDACKVETRYRFSVNTPILNEDGEIEFILYSSVNVGEKHLTLQKIKREEQELKEKQQLLDKAYQLARIGTWEFDMRSHNLYWSPVTKEVHGFNHNYEPELQKTIDLFKEGIDRETFAQAVKDAIENKKPFDVELKIISGQGDERWIRATGEPEFKDGECVRFYGISQNVTDRRQAEEDLHLSEQRFKSLVQDGSDLIAILDMEGNYQYVSPTSETVLGIAAKDFIGKNAFDYIHEEDKERVFNLLSNLSFNQRVSIPPYRFIDSQGNWRWMETTLTNMTEDPAVGGLVANSRDVTEQKLQQQQSLESLKEKETLLAEIHHRVKNNLAVVSGMMQLQVSEDENEEITDRLLDSITRIKTMANIHEQLYQSNSFSKLDFADNIKSLVLDIQKTFQSVTKVHIDFNCQVVQLNINQAIPCSLIVNEVITNVFKHAFPNRKEGDIVVTLTEFDKSENILLSISDNGVGLPKHFDTADSTSLGLTLVDVLTQQLEADYKYESGDKGTVFTLEFKKDEVKGIGNNFL